MIDVALSTSAAPSYFPIYSYDQGGNRGSYVDGGLIVNSPAYCGVHEALYYLDISRDQIHLMSIGTLGSRKTLKEEGNIKPLIYGKGLIAWAKDVVDLSMSSSESLHEFWVNKILGDNYLKVDDSLENDQAKYIDIDAASDGALTTLKNRGADRAQKLMGEKRFQELMKHTVKEPVMYEKGEPIGAIE